MVFAAGASAHPRAVKSIRRLRPPISGCKTFSLAQPAAFCRHCVSFATLTFSGPLSGLLGYGIAIRLLAASIGAFVIGSLSTLPIVIAGADSPTSAVLAVLVANFVHRLVAEGAS